MKEKVKILIVDDDRRMAKTLEDILVYKGYEARCAHSGAEALDKATGARFDCVLTDIKMPGMNGVELFKAIKAVQPDVPVVLMTAYSADELVREGLKEGAITSLTKPLDIDALLRFFSMLRDERLVAVVDDEPCFLDALGDILRERGFKVIRIGDPHGAVGRIGEDVHVVILDMKLNDLDGLDVLVEIRKKHPRLPVILVTGHQEEMSARIAEALEAKACACLYKPLRMEELFDLLRDVHHERLGAVLGPAPYRFGIEPPGKRENDD